MASLSSRAAFLLVALAACNDLPQDSAPAEVDGDGDGDGYPLQDDCDDGDAAVHPGAEEVCDGIDNDCDGQSDEGLGKLRRWYADSDDDGYGDALIWEEDCEQPSGYVSDASDCDDGDAAVHPGAEETWYDGVDADCDGASDYDADGDGHDSQEQGGGTDCDDEDEAVHPGQLDWSDGYDSDCDGTADQTGPPGATAIVLGDELGDHAAYALEGVGDVDGDGLDDLLLGAPGRDLAFLLPGAISGTAAASQVATATVSGEAGIQLGSALAAAGDADGDGYADLLLGARLAEGMTGAAYLLHGPLSGATDLGEAQAVLLGEQLGDYAGCAVAGAGDVDGDGHADQLLGARGADGAGEEAGAALLFLGPLSGQRSAAGADAWLEGEASRAFAGCAVAGVGDSDGDGLDDLLVGARGEESGGRAYLLLGPVSGQLSLAAAAAVMEGADAFDYAGGALAGPGDVDGDGLADLLVGAYGNDAGGSNAGAAYLLLGRAEKDWTSPVALSSSDAVLPGETSNDRAGIAVAGAGDVDGNGHADLLVGADDAGEDGRGAAYLVLGPVQGSYQLEWADIEFGGDEEDEGAGSAVAGAGDGDGDGLADFLVGAHLRDEGGSEAGAAFLLRGEEP